MSTTTLRKELKDQGATEWNILEEAAAAVAENNDFAEMWFKVQSHVGKTVIKESRLYPDTKELFQKIVNPLGVCYHAVGEAKTADEKSPDGRLVASAAFDHGRTPSDTELIILTLLDVEVKKTWTPTRQLDTPWSSLPTNGTDGGTPSSGLKEIIERYGLFFSNQQTQQQEYYGVITDLQKFVFVSITRDGSLKMTYALNFDKGVVAVIWYLCSCTLNGAGFRRSARLLPPCAFTPTLLSSESPLTIETDSHIRWRLGSLRLLGNGAHGTVFACKQHQTLPSQFDQDLCLKVAPLSSPEAVEQLDLERRHLNMLRECPCVPKVIACGQLLIDSTPCQGLLTDTVGVPLPQLSASNLRQIFPDLWFSMLNTLSQIHKQGVVHGDVKPEHFIINRSGLYLIDFGSAHTQYTRIFRQGQVRTTRMFASAAVLERNEWPTPQDDLESAAYSFIALLTPSCTLPEGHQFCSSILLSSVRPRYQGLVKTVLSDAGIALRAVDTYSTPRSNFVPSSELHIAFSVLPTTTAKG